MKKVKIKLEARKGICKDCFNEFQIPDFPDFQYGSRLFWTEDGTELGLVVCYEDETFMRVSKSVKDLCAGTILNSREISDCFDSIFCLTCDLIDDKRLHPSQRKACPQCHSTLIDEFYLSPPKSIEVSVYVLVHEEWNKKSNMAQINFMQQKINEFIEAKGL